MPDFITESLGSVTPSFLSERCDGNRNIFHAVVNMCTPNSNKNSDSGEYCVVLFTYF